MDSDASAKFIGSLTKFLQSLCNGYVEFQKGVELVGHIYLNIDTGEKVDYVLHEKVNKSYENSVTFVSNSFHAYPPDKEKNKGKDATPKASSGKSVTSDDDDIVIIDPGNKVIPGSTNSGTIPSRKRMPSPGSDHRPNMKQMRSSNQVSSRQHIGGPSSTVSNQEGLNVSEMKLEQLSSDELLSLASQVGEGQSRPLMHHSRNQRPGASAIGSSGDAPSWIKQEAPDDAGGDSDTGWSQGRDESNSNSGSNLYPVMLHQNTSTYSNPVFPGAAPSYSNPVPGTSQDISGLDPSDKQVEEVGVLRANQDGIKLESEHSAAAVKIEDDEHSRRECSEECQHHVPFKIVTPRGKRTCIMCKLAGRKTGSRKSIQSTFECRLCGVALCKDRGCFRDFHLIN